MEFINKRDGILKKDEASRGGVVEDAMDVLDEWGREFKYGGDSSVMFLFYALTSLFTSSSDKDKNVGTRKDVAVDAGYVQQLLHTGEECQWKPFYIEYAFGNLVVLMQDDGDGSGEARQDALFQAAGADLLRVARELKAMHPQHAGVQDHVKSFFAILGPVAKRAESFQEV